MKALDDHFQGQRPWRLRAWEVAQPRDPYAAVGVLREALTRVLARQKIVGGHNSAWRQVRTEDLTMAQNALSLVPEFMSRPPAVPDPRGDPLLAAAVCELRDAARELHEGALTGFMEGGVIIKEPIFQRLGRAVETFVTVAENTPDAEL